MYRKFQILIKSESFLLRFPGNRRNRKWEEITDTNYLKDKWGKFLAEWDIEVKILEEQVVGLSRGG